MPRRAKGPNRGRRGDRKWLHAGLVRNSKGNVIDIWYSFMKGEKGKYRVSYASDNQGRRFKNFNAGKNKRDMLRWDEHHLQKIIHVLTADGTWVRRKKMAGVELFRETLLATYLDRQFQDPHPKGKEDRTLGPDMNTLFDEDEFCGPMPAGFVNRPERILAKKDYYPKTRIPLSIDGIEIDAWKTVNPQSPDAKLVVVEFLTAKMAKGMFINHAERQLKRIESAFFELGWRLNRTALRTANMEMKDGKVTNAFGCAAWRKHPPFRVDKFKGQNIEQLMKGMRDDATADGNVEDEDDDDSGDESGSEDSDSDSDSDNAPDHDSLFVGQRRISTPVGAGPSNYRERAHLQLQRSILQQLGATPDNAVNRDATRLAGPSSSDKDDYEYLSDNSPDKGKGKAVSRTISFGMPGSDSDKSPSERPIVIDIDSDDEDVKPSSETPTKRVKTSPGPRIVIEIEDSDSEIEIDEDRSTAPAIQTEKELLKNEIIDTKDANTSSYATQ